MKLKSVRKSSEKRRKLGIWSSERRTLLKVLIVLRSTCGQTKRARRAGTCRQSRVFEFRILKGD